MNVGEVPAKNVFGTGGGFGGSVGLQDSGPDVGVHEQVSVSPPFGQKSPHPGTMAFPSPGVNVSPGDCHYFLQGACAKGESCLFRHNEAAKASGTVCRFWQNGFCKDDANCSFQHPSGMRGHMRAGGGGRFGLGRGPSAGRNFGGRGILRPHWEPVDRSSQACVFYAQGKCMKGDMCPFSHASLGPANRNSTAAATSVVPKARSEDASSQPQQVSLPANPLDSKHEEVRTQALPEGVHAPLHAPIAADTREEPIAAASESADAAMPLRSNNRREQPKQEGRRVGASNLRVSPPSERDEPFRSMAGPTPSASAPPMRITDDGARYAVGPDNPVPHVGVARTMTPGPPSVPTSNQKNSFGLHVPEGALRSSSRNDQGHVSVVSRLDERPAPQGGIIALSDGGFITRKRATQLQRNSDDHAGRDMGKSRHVEVPEHPGMRKHNLGVSETRALPNSRGSIMDRLGPIPSSQASATSAEPTAVGNKKARPDYSDERTNTNSHKRVRTGVIERRMGASQTPLTSAPSRLGTRGVARHLKPSEGGQGGVVNLRRLDRTTTGKKFETLGFKVQSLEEIKSRQAYLQRAEEGESGWKPDIEGTLRSTKVESAAASSKVAFADNSGRNTTGLIPSGDKVKPKAGTMAKKVARGLDVKSPSPVASSPEAISTLTDQQMYAADMDEFSEWM